MSQPAVAEPAHPAEPEPGPLVRFFRQGQAGPGEHPHEKSHPWWLVLWLTGMDYFSTLGYQPGIAFLAAAELSPVATAVRIVTLLPATLTIRAAPLSST